MQFPLAETHHDRWPQNREAGFVLVAALVVLLALSMFGIWAIRTATFEVDIAGNMQGAEKQFNISEGATIREAVSLSHNNPSDPSYKSFYNVSDTQVSKLLDPTTPAAFDPGGDTAAVVGGVVQANPATWPTENLFGNTLDDEFDYRYLSAYLNADTPPKGYDADKFSSYKFRVQGSAPTVIEMGISIVGPKE